MKKLSSCYTLVLAAVYTPLFKGGACAGFCMLLERADIGMTKHGAVRSARTSSNTAVLFMPIH
jgi:hypothetical protein